MSSGVHMEQEESGDLWFLRRPGLALRVDLCVTIILWHAALAHLTTTIVGETSC